jgi:hypothetical protein
MKFNKILFMNSLEFSSFADFLSGFLNQRRVWFSSKSVREKGQWIAWSKRLESFVKLMSKNSISDLEVHATRLITRVLHCHLCAWGLHHSMPPSSVSRNYVNPTARCRHATVPSPLNSGITRIPPNAAYAPEYTPPYWCRCTWPVCSLNQMRKSGTSSPTFVY